MNALSSIVRFFITSALCVWGVHVLWSYEAFAHTDIVIARYKESITYLNNPIFRNFRTIYLYNKGPEFPPDWLLANNIQVISLPNVGCEGHTYLHHILNNTETLADMMLFLPGSCFDSPLKKMATISLLQSFYFKDFSATGLYYEHPIYEHLYDFSLASYQHSHHNNQHSNAILAPCSERPYGAWYQKNFPDRQSDFASYLGIVCASKARIEANDRYFYEQLIGYLENDRNPEAGHYLERSWGVIFAPQSREVNTSNVIAHAS